MKNNSHNQRSITGLSILAITLLSAGAGAQTIINSCSILDSPGYYVLGNNLLDSTPICINITSSNVIFDGAGHVIEGSNIIYGNGVYQSYGVLASSPGGAFRDDSPPLENVTVRNVTLRNRRFGIFYGKITSGSIINTSVSNNSGWTAIYLDNSRGIVITDNNVTSNRDNGIYIGRSTYNMINNNSVSTLDSNDECGGWECIGIFLDHNTSFNTVANNTLYNNMVGLELNDNSNYNRINDNKIQNNLKYGIGLISLFPESTEFMIGEKGNSHNILADNVLADNHQWDFYENSSGVTNENNTVIDTKIGNVSVSFTGFEMALRQASAPAQEPDGYRSAGVFINATTNNANSWVFLNISYNRAPGVEENTLRMWQFDGSWKQVSGTNGVETTDKYVFASITTSGIFTPMGSTASSTATPSPTPALDPTPSPTPNVISIYIYDTNGNNRIDKSEALQAIMDYFVSVITKQKAIEVLMAYFSGL